MKPVDPWVEEEFEAVELGDTRRRTRLLQLAHVLGTNPGASLPQACQTWADLKAAYRLFDNPAVTPQAILASHTAATLARCRAYPLILCPQDTTSLTFTHHPATTGLGPLNTKRQQGLYVHTTTAVTPAGLPLGILAQQVWRRLPRTYAKLPHRRTRTIHQKESSKWLHSVEALNALAARAPDTTFVSMGDREADVYDLFVLPRQPNVQLLIRAEYNRALYTPLELETHYLRQRLAQQRCLLTRTVQVRERKGQPGREATVQVRMARLMLRPPCSRQREGLPPVLVTAILVTEECPPPGVTPISWLLLTTLVIETHAELEQCLAWYGLRWSIEVWHHMLKSGCRIEARQLETRARLERFLALASVIAWRVQYVTLLAREIPEAPCTAVFTEAEWHTLYALHHRSMAWPAEPPALRTVTRWLAQQGGFIGRHRDGEPGVQTIWQGMQALVLAVELYDIAISQRPPP